MARMLDLKMDTKALRALSKEFKFRSPKAFHLVPNELQNDQAFASMNKA